MSSDDSPEDDSEADDRRERAKELGLQQSPGRLSRVTRIQGETGVPREDRRGPSRRTGDGV